MHSVVRDFIYLSLVCGLAFNPGILLLVNWVFAGKPVVIFAISSWSFVCCFIWILFCWDRRSAHRSDELEEARSILATENADMGGALQYFYLARILGVFGVIFGMISGCLWLGSAVGSGSVLVPWSRQFSISGVLISALLTTALVFLFRRRNFTGAWCIGIVAATIDTYIYLVQSRGADKFSWEAKCKRCGAPAVRRIVPRQRTGLCWDCWGAYCAVDRSKSLYSTAYLLYGFVGGSVLVRLFLWTNLNTFNVGWLFWNVYMWFVGWRFWKAIRDALHQLESLDRS